MKTVAVLALAILENRTIRRFLPNMSATLSPLYCLIYYRKTGDRNGGRNSKGYLRQLRDLYS